MTDELSESLQRLTALSVRAKQRGQGMSVPEIIEAVLGRAPEQELVSLVTAAFESNGINPMGESEMVVGIMLLDDWRDRNA